jgi:hypothetical protein
MSGLSVTLYNNFMEAQGPLYITSPSDVVNDAQLFRTYSTGALMGGDRGMKKMVSGGSEIRFATFFQTGQVTKHVQPGETRTWSQPQKLVHGAVKMRFRETHMAWTRQAIMLNEGARSGDPTKMFHQFVDHRRHLEQQMWTDYWDFDEAYQWSEPDGAEIEAAAGGTEGRFYNIPSFVNEYTNGLYNNTGTAGNAFTTIEGIDPTSTIRGQDRFKHPVVVYSNAIVSNGSLVGPNTILVALDKAWKKVHFEKPPMQGEYFSDPAYNNQQIFTSEAGQLAYTIALRASQDLFVIAGRQDSAFTDPSFNFIPVKYVTALQTATLYPAGTAGTITNNVAESDSAALYPTGPRYYFINSNYLYPVFDEDMFFERGKVREHFNDPDTFVMPVFIWGNMICTSRQRQCLIRPGGSGDLYIAGGTGPNLYA